MLKYSNMTVVFVLHIFSLKENYLKHDQMMKYFGDDILSWMNYCLIRLVCDIMFIHIV